MNNLKKFFKDTIYVSRVTKTNNKKSLIFIAVILSQLSAGSDILIILFFSFLISDNLSTSDFLEPYVEILFSIPIFLPILIFLRYLFNYSQIMILKNLELNVQKNLKVHLLGEIFNKRNYSVADAYYYINNLTTHISFFYSSIAGFLNHLLQIFAFSLYLIFSNPNIILSFVVGVFLLSYPILYLLKQARKYMHDSYIFGQDSNVEIQRVVDNMFLIKLLNKEIEETNRFSKTLEKFNISLYKNNKFGVLNSFLPSFLTLFLLSIVILFTRVSKIITLDIIGISLRLFQSLGNLTTSVNQIINSYVHLEKFYEIENSKAEINKSNFIRNSISNKDLMIQFNKASFKYENAETYIFESLNLEIKKSSHCVITGQNGSGKSTLLGLMAGVYYPTKGKVYTDSQKVGFVGASPLIFTATLRENILYGNNEIIDDEKILDLVKSLNTFNEKSSYDLNKLIDNKSLSSGQTQKIAFIRALLMKPDLLLLDESTANLDDYSSNKIFQIIQENNTTIINSTHDPEKFKEVDSHINIKVENDQRFLEIIR